ncbi:MAG: glycosyltransferase, partial [Chromatiales bacterium]|nr:glycosyltransferase [Chromatiales bacterium]
QGYGVQRQRAQSFASCDWILMLDADERVAPALAVQIQRVLDEDDRKRAFELARLSWCFGRFIRHGGWYPDHVLRLYPRERGRSTDALVHEKIEVDAGVRVERLHGNLLHYTYNSVRHYLVKSANYAAAWAQQREERGRSASLAQGIVHGIGCFLRMYVLRLGVLDGRAGLLLALLSAHSTFVKYADLWVRKQSPIPPPATDRILELCLSNGHGGLELYAARLCGLLRERGYDCRALTAPDTLFAQRMTAQDILHDTLRVRLRRLPLIAAFRLARYLEREQIDVLHIHWSNDLPLAAFAKRLCKRPVRLIHSRHMRITRAKLDPYHRLLYQAIDGFVVLSRGMQDDAAHYLPLRPGVIELAYLGVPAPAANEPKSGAFGDSLQIGLFGRIEPPKGQHVLVEAVDLLHRQGIRAHARIVGHVMNETYMASLREEVRQRGLEPHIDFPGFISSPQRTMLELDVVVLASENETFGLVLIEAMRCGVAVIGTNAGGVPEIIKDGRSGLLFTPGSATELAEKLRYLAEHPDEMRRLAQAGKTRADEMFSEEAHLARIEAVLLPNLKPVVASPQQ